MNAIELRDGIKDGSIKVDARGHNTSLSAHKPNFGDEFVKERIISRLDRYLEMYEEEEDADQKEYYHKALIEPIHTMPHGPREDYIMIFGAMEEECRHCGAYMYVYLAKDEKSVYLKGADGEEIACPFADGFEKANNTINVPSGELLFANFFLKGEELPDCTEDQKYTSEWSVSRIIGRMNIAKSLADQDIGYGQVGNTTITLFVNKERTKIKILDCPESIIDNFEWMMEEEPENITPVYKGIYDRTKALLLSDWEEVGEICLSMWRYMCADRQVYDKAGLTLNASRKTEITDDEEHVLCQVKPGKWEIIHHYDTSASGDDNLVAELNLV